MRRYFLAFLMAVAGLYAQSQCNLTNATAPATGTGRSAALSNKGPYCNSWVLQFWTTGFSTVTLEFDTASDNGSNQPGAWGLAAGVTLAGANPLTAGTSGFLIMQTYAPWLSVNVNSVTGTGTITFLLNGAAGITAKTGGASGANTALSNLTTTAINQSLLFNPDQTFNIGASGNNRPATIFAGNATITNTVTAQNVTASAAVSGATYATATNCLSTNGTCGSAAAGTTLIAAAATTVTISTSAAHSASQINVFDNPTVGASLAVTCNTTVPTSLIVTAINNNLSFTVTVNPAPVTNPLCISYTITN